MLEVEFSVKLTLLRVDIAAIIVHAFRTNKKYQFLCMYDLKDIQIQICFYRMSHESRLSDDVSFIHVNIVMTTLSAGLSNVITSTLTTMQFFIEISKL